VHDLYLTVTFAFNPFRIYVYWTKCSAQPFKLWRYNYLSCGPTWSEINFAERFHCRFSIAVYKGGLELREEDQPDAHFS